MVVSSKVVQSAGFTLMNSLNKVHILAEDVVIFAVL